MKKKENLNKSNGKKSGGGDTIKAETAVWVLIGLFAIGSLGYGFSYWNMSNRFDDLGSKVNNLSSQILDTKQSLIKLYNNDLSSEVMNNIANSMVVVVSSPAEGPNSLSQSVIFIDSKNGPQALDKGAGFFTSCDGYIITAAHVVSKASEIWIIGDGNIEHRIPATLILTDTNFDVAVLKIDAKKTPPVKIGNYSILNVGKKVSFIGYPLTEQGYELLPVYNEGTISSVYPHRRITGTIQVPTFTIDGSVNHGNSGGPVFLADTGEVVGVVSEKLNEQGIGIITSLDPRFFRKTSDGGSVYSIITKNDC